MNKRERNNGRRFRMNAKLLVAIALLAWWSIRSGGAADQRRPEPSKKSPAIVTGDARVDKLLGEMTLEEKIE